MQHCKFEKRGKAAQERNIHQQQARLLSCVTLSYHPRETNAFEGLGYIAWALHPLISMRRSPEQMGHALCAEWKGTVWQTIVVWTQAWRGSGRSLFQHGRCSRSDLSHLRHVGRVGNSLHRKKSPPHHVSHPNHKVRPALMCTYKGICDCVSRERLRSVRSHMRLRNSCPCFCQQCLETLKKNLKKKHVF